MINEITISDVASFPPEGITIDHIKPINFIYGANGVGKTTISRVLANQEKYPDCVVENDNDSKIFVYNKDYVTNNFKEQLPGVFVLGQENKTVTDNIQKFTASIKSLEAQKAKILKSLKESDIETQKADELERIDNKFSDECWAQKSKMPKNLFTGYNSKKLKFFKQLLLEKEKLEKENFDFKKLPHCTDPFKVICDDLSKQAKLLFEGDVTIYAKLDTIDQHDIDKIDEIVCNGIFGKAIVGKENLNISELIQKINNSDWVKQGLDYAKLAEGKCPFCQQELSDQILKSLTEYFDESYEKDIQELNKLKTQLNNESKIIFSTLETNESKDCFNKYTDAERMKLLKQSLTNYFETLNKKIDNKIKNPSIPIVLSSFLDIAAPINKALIEANGKIVEHNNIMSDLKTSRSNLSGLAWQYLIMFVNDDLQEYLSQRKEVTQRYLQLEKEINGINTEIKSSKASLNNEKKKAKNIITAMEKINELLTEVGFVGFKLDVYKDDDKENDYFYEIVRDGGDPCKDTLSEGERNFLTFLYFYFQLSNESNADASKIVVIDDPVSSMDSTVMFAVSVLIRMLFQDIQKDNQKEQRKNNFWVPRNVEQVFVLSHNVYFYNDLTNKDGLHRSKVSFFVLSKYGKKSEIHHYDENPIKTTYAMLWQELRNIKKRIDSNPEAENLNLNLVPNLMRRILDYYFTIIGAKSVRKVVSAFESEDRLICLSLLRWVNAGSHSFIDEISYESIAVENFNRYWEIFKQIFVKAGQGQHYDLMMSQDDEIEKGAEKVS